LKKIQSEHGQIAAAIRARDSAAARRAMRVHLGNSLMRYRRLAKLAAE
jgi:GntR family transcriptional repressor for pyruvate dehydrogenase complex